MIIEHSEVLRTWLTNTLSPICDADPAALAKYVMALLKKDKPEQELKDFCIDQLDVFLQKETKGFVEQLFVVIRDKSYLNPPVAKQEAVGMAPAAPNVVTIASAPEISAHSSVDTSRTSSKDVTIVDASTSRRHSREERQLKTSRSSTKSRSRSRSKDRSRRGGAVIDKPLRQQYVAGPSSSTAGSNSRDRDKENRESRHTRQSSPKERKRGSSRERIRQRSRDGTPISENNSLTLSSMEITTPENERTKTGDKDKKRKKQRCRDYDEKGYCMRGDSCPYDHGPDPVVVEEMALPRMITMKAPPPPVDFSQPPPGYNPVPPPPGVDHAFTAATEAYNPEAPSISSSNVSTSSQPKMNTTSYSQRPPHMWNQPPPNYAVPFGGMKSAYRSRELITLAEGEQPQLMSSVRIVGSSSSYGGYRPDKPQVMLRPPPNASQTPYDKTNCTLEVRRIPTSFNTIAKLNEHFSQFGQIINIQVRYQNDPEAALVTFATRPQAVSAYKSTTPIFNNRFIRMFWHNKDGGNDMGGSDRPSVKDRLGPAPVDPSAPVDDSSMKPRMVDTVEDADGNRRSVLLSATGNLTKTVYNPAALRSAAAAVHMSQESVSSSQQSFPPQQQLQQQLPSTPAQQPFVPNDRGALLKKQQVRMEKAKEVYKRQIELQRAKTELFTKQIEQQKKLLLQLEKCKQPAQRKEILKTIKAVEKSIKTLKDELQEIKLPPNPSTKTKEQVERQLLDTELEMISQQQSGSDTTDLHRRLLDLRREVMLLNELTSIGVNNTSTPVQQAPNLQSTPNANPNRPGGRPHHRKIPAHTILDKRPRDLMVIGFGSNEKDALIEHLQQFGVLEDIEFLHQIKDQPCRALVIYKWRKDAEMAVAKGKEFQSKTLDIQWFNRRNQIPSEKDDSKNEMTAQDILATLDDEDDASSDDNPSGEMDEDVPEIERGWKR